MKIAEQASMTIVAVSLKHFFFSMKEPEAGRH
jgi:hypothetical protein